MYVVRVGTENRTSLDNPVILAVESFKVTPKCTENLSQQGLIKHIHNNIITYNNVKDFVFRMYVHTKPNTFYSAGIGALRYTLLYIILVGRCL